MGGSLINWSLIVELGLKFTTFTSKVYFTAFQRTALQQ